MCISKAVSLFCFILGDTSDRKGDENFSADDLDRIHTRLCKIAQKHIDAIDIFNKIVETYMFNIFTHFLTSALLVCMACINFTIVNIQILRIDQSFK